MTFTLLHYCDSLYSFTHTLIIIIFFKYNLMATIWGERFENTKARKLLATFSFLLGFVWEFIGE